MLEGFTEMDALAERGFVPRMTAVCTAFPGTQYSELYLQHIKQNDLKN